MFNQHSRASYDQPSDSNAGELAYSSESWSYALHLHLISTVLTVRVCLFLTVFFDLTCDFVFSLFFLFLLLLPGILTALSHSLSVGDHNRDRPWEGSTNSTYQHGFG